MGVFVVKYSRRTQRDQDENCVLYVVLNSHLSLLIFLTLWLAGFQSHFWSFVRISQTPQVCGFIVLSLLTNSLKIFLKYLC